MNHIIKFLKMLFLAPLATIIVGILCFMPSENVPELTGDKSAHLISFAIVSFLWFVRFPHFMTFFAMCAMGVGIEFIQKILPEDFHRGFEVADMIADFKGVIIGYILFLIYDWILKKVHFE